MKELLKSTIGLLVAFFYSMLKAKYPDFPLDSSAVLSLILWALGFAVGGWQARSFLLRKRGQ